MKPHILFLTAGYGEGHNAAARALAAAADERFGPGGGRMIDLFSVCRPRINAFSRRAYLSLINRAPGLWRSAYSWLDRSARAPGLVRLLRRETQALGQLITRERPAAICSTYPIYAYMLEQLRRQGFGPTPPHFNVVTDSISINSLWWRAPCEGWFVPNDESAVTLRLAGVDPARIRVLGFPVLSAFADERESLSPPEIGPDQPPRVLYIINSGTQGAAETAFRLLEEHDWDVTCTVGRNETLRTQLMRAAEDRPRSTPILGWTNEIPRLLMTHHVVVSKAGGATTQEAIAAHCPMIVSQIVPGQEEGNYELLRRHGIGTLASTPEAVVAALRDAFADNGRVWRQWRDSVRQLSRPRAARDIISVLAEQIATGKLPESRLVA